MVLAERTVMYRHILVPTDGSELSNAAVEHAVALAKAVKAKLTALTVSIPYYSSTIAPELSLINIETYQDSSAKLAMQNLEVAKIIAARSEVACDTIRIENAQPYQGIIDTAKERGCDLIVMASHGRRGIAAIVLGSETVKVLTHSSVPVLVVRPPKT
jgi:nucleotide-binding universal stress UspA family protein